MFTPPPWPPKDYIIKDVQNHLQSSSVITPTQNIRVTQPNLAKHCSPIEYNEGDVVTPQIKKVHKKVIENWVDKNRAWWVDKPGQNAKFLHDLHKNCKYSSASAGNANNPLFQHKEKVFNRPFMYELDCVEFRRLKKLQDKSDQEQKELCDRLTDIEETKRLKKQEKESIKVIPCEWQPPFWWKSNDKIKDDSKIQQNVLPVASKTTYEESYLKWQDVPNFFTQTEDVCEKRKAFFQYVFLNNCIRHVLI